MTNQKTRESAVQAAERRLACSEMEVSELRTRLDKLAKSKVQGKMAGGEIAISLAQHDYAVKALQAEVKAERKHKLALLDDLSSADQCLMERAPPLPCTLAASLAQYTYLTM